MEAVTFLLIAVSSTTLCLQFLLQIKSNVLMHALKTEYIFFLPTACEWGF